MLPLTIPLIEWLGSRLHPSAPILSFPSVLTSAVIFYRVKWSNNLSARLVLTLEGRHNVKMWHRYNLICWIRQLWCFHCMKLRRVHGDLVPYVYVQVMLFKKVTCQKFRWDCVLMNFADENMMFLIEEEVCAHDNGFRLSRFRLNVQSHGLGFGTSLAWNNFSWWRLVPVLHTKSTVAPAGFPRYNFVGPTGNLFFVVETDPRPHLIERFSRGKNAWHSG